MKIALFPPLVALTLYVVAPDDTIGTFFARLASISVWKPFALYFALQVVVSLTASLFGRAYRLGKGTPFTRDRGAV